MESEVVSTARRCQLCNKNFSSTSARNQHTRKFHPESTQDLTTKINRISCPMCRNDKFLTYLALNKHLLVVHNTNVKESVLTFRSYVEFEEWRAIENRAVDYACRTRRKFSNGEESIYFECNRSDSRGFASTCTKRCLKNGGSIRIQGTCPSKIIVRIHTTGEITVKFTETHVGHVDELRTKRLSKIEQEHIVQELKAGVSNDRILENSRKLESDQLMRRNLVTRADLRYLIAKFNIDKKRNADDMIAIALKVEEWNSQGKNYTFLFKKIGESYPDLTDEDFAIGYMNGIMEKKLKDFKRVICIDGTHGTNNKHYELTTVLVKDENNMGFPIAFLITNRRDQKIQEIFFRAIRCRLGESIDAEYLMSDDDSKYFKAWIKVMECKPRKLLCTWHVIKNWNVQGRLKIKNVNIRQEMKTQMRKILKETDVIKFTEFKENYFSYLQKENEIDFLKYLQNYYFQNEERIMTWAHCHRINAGINTNMAIESLNKLLKYNKMKGQCNFRVEKLLDLLEEIVDEKMWKKIISTERPNSNNYQHKITMESHKKAEHTEGIVEMFDIGIFKVKSSSENGKFYFVCINELCDKGCRTSYCVKCKICLHRYKCQCPDNSVKSVLCKHIHAVALYEQRSDSVLGQSSEDPNDRHIDEPSTSHTNYQVDVAHFIQENLKRDVATPVNFEDRKEIIVNAICNYAKGMDEENLDMFLAKVMEFRQQNPELSCKKRKMEKQTYYPNK